jgi:hypothetical protein
VARRPELAVVRREEVVRRDPPRRGPADRCGLRELRPELGRAFGRAPAERDEVARRRLVPFRNAGGISAWTTAFVSCGIKRSRKLAIRSSWRRMLRARRTVSRSPTFSASVSIAV